ncbi:hypothetical protein Q1695_000017 [Nippostrongylus brasiliensis]|nr:hypothetical protein Q1695_000017 [Nippostrongylus brasiliensis]
MVFSPSVYSSRITAFSSIIDPATKYHIAHNETHLHSLAMDITKLAAPAATQVRDLLTETTASLNKRRPAKDAPVAPTAVLRNHRAQ